MQTVLIVDDDVDLARVSVDVLRHEGYEVRMATNGEEGLSRLHERLPNVLVLDVQMPLLDGPELAARMLIEDCGMERVPIVLVSGAVDLDRIAERVGTPYALGKPFAFDDLLHMVRRALAQPVPCERPLRAHNSIVR